jgi:hypothetical protein
MGIIPTKNGPSEIAILGRILSNGRKHLPTSLARFLLTLDFTTTDKARMRDLAAKNQTGALSSEEREELQGYAKAGCILGILQSKARKALKIKNVARSSSHG